METINKWKNYFKDDYASVRIAVKRLTNGKMPEWGCIAWYVIFIPLGIILMPVVWVRRCYVNRALNKQIKEMTIGES